MCSRFAEICWFGAISGATSCLGKAELGLGVLQTIRTQVFGAKQPSWARHCIGHCIHSRWTLKSLSFPLTASCQALSWMEVPGRASEDKHLQMGQWDRFSPREGHRDQTWLLCRFWMQLLPVIWGLAL